MDSADVYEVMRALLRGPLEQAAALEASAQNVLDRVKALDRPQAWADVLVYVLVRIAELDRDHLSVSADADTVTLTMTRDGGRASLALAAFGAAPPAVVVTVDGEVDHQAGPLTVDAGGRGGWRIGLDGVALPQGDARCHATATLPVGRVPAEVPGIEVKLGEEFVVDVTLRTAEPLWTVDVRVPAISAAVVPGALIGMPDGPRAGAGFAPALHAAQGGAATLSLGAS